jgi:hypothetical protein
MDASRRLPPSKASEGPPGVIMDYAQAVRLLKPNSTDSMKDEFDRVYEEGQAARALGNK